MSKTAIIVAVIVLIIIGLIFVAKRASEQPESATDTDVMEKTSFVEPPVSGNIDDAIDAILVDISGDEEPIGENDPSLLTEDQSVTDFADTLNVNQF